MLKGSRIVLQLLFGFGLLGEIYMFFWDSLFVKQKKRTTDTKMTGSRLPREAAGCSPFPFTPPETLVNPHFAPPPDSHFVSWHSKASRFVRGNACAIWTQSPPTPPHPHPSVFGGGAGRAGVRRLEQAQVVSHCRLQQMRPRGADRQVWLQQQEGSEQLSTLYSPCVCLWSHDHRHAHVRGRCAHVCVGGCGQTLRYLHKFLVTRVISFWERHFILQLHTLPDGFDT